MTNEKPLKLDMTMDELVARAAQTNPDELVDVARESMSESTIDDLIDSFEASAHKDEMGMEFWYARELQELLGYSKWENFESAMNRAQESCKNSGVAVENHWLPDVRKSISGKGREADIVDYKLSRYACYLIAQNASSKNKAVAFAQTYFAIQTRRQELTDRNGVNFDQLSEAQKRLYMRNQVVEENKRLASAAKGAGVVSGPDFSVFQAKGYQGLYGGRNVKEILLHKGLPKGAKILDHMGSAELAANLFRITQTEEKLRKEQIYGKEKANTAHYEVGQQVRKAMQQIGGTLPEDLPAECDVKKLAKQEKHPQVAVKYEKPKQIENKPVNLGEDIWKYALLIMAQKQDGETSTTELIAELPKYIQIPEQSLQPLQGRKDNKFTQLVRNLKSHKTTKTNFIYQGYAEDVKGGFKITEKGRQFVMSEFKDRL